MDLPGHLGSSQIRRQILGEVMRLRIGEFARMHGVGIQTLHYYDAKGILKPAWIDAETGYRYYDEESSDQLWKIKALKSAGLSLGEIQELLDSNLSDTEAFFEKTAKELEEKIRKEQQSLKYLNRSLRAICKWNREDWIKEPRIMEISERTGYVIDVQESDDMETRYRALESFQKNKPLHVDVLFHPSRVMQIDKRGTPKLACYGALTEDPIDDAELKMPKGLFVVLDHIGIQQSVRKSYQRIFDFCRDEGLQLTGNALELFVIDPHLSSKPKDWVRQIQVEVQK